MNKLFNETALLDAMLYESDFERSEYRGHEALQYAYEDWKDEHAARIQRVELIMQLRDLREESIGQGKILRSQLRFLSAQLSGVLLLLLFLTWRGLR